MHILIYSYIFLYIRSIYFCTPRWTGHLFSPTVEGKKSAAPPTPRHWIHQGIGPGVPLNRSALISIRKWLEWNEIRLEWEPLGAWKKQYFCCLTMTFIIDIMVLLFFFGKKWGVVALKFCRKIKTCHCGRSEPNSVPFYFDFTDCNNHHGYTFF